VPAFGKRSRAALSGIDPRLQELAERVIEVADFSVLEGLRTPERQRELFEQGASKTMNSRHLVGMALDFCPYPVTWKPPQFILLGGYFLATARAMSETTSPGFVIRWGGDWRGDFKMKTWPDFGHIEIPRGKE